MKIANIACAWPPYAGGMARAAQQIGNILATEHQVENFTPAQLRPWLKYGHGALLPQLLWRLKKFDYIYLHYPFFGSAEIVYLFKIFHRHRPKLIIHYHMDVKSSSLATALLSWPGRLAQAGLFKRADLIVSASLDYVKNGTLKNYYQKYPHKFREIPFGLDLKKFQPKLINRPTDNQLLAQAQKIIHYVNDKFIKRQRLNLLFVGGLDKAHYFKGLPVLLTALSGLETKNWRLKIIGQGDRKIEYEQLAENLGLSAQINFSGPCSEEELIRSYQEADCLILPSINRNEAFGLVLIEALACGTPVIASDLPGVRRVFNNYETGLLVEPGSISDLTSKLNFILKHEEERQKMAQAARIWAEKNYDLKDMNNKLLRLFQPETEI